MSKNRLPRQKRRIQIIQTAVELFADKGFKGTTTRKIARSASISEAIIFRHFATKEELYDAIILHVIEERLRAWAEEVASEDTADLDTLLRSFAHAYIRRNRQNPTFIRLLMYSALEEHKFRKRLFEIYRLPRVEAIRKAIQAGVRKGTFRPVDPKLTLQAFLWTLLHHCISCFVVEKQDVARSSDEKMVDNLVTIFMHGLQFPVESP